MQNSDSERSFQPNVQAQATAKPLPAATCSRNELEKTGETGLSGGVDSVGFTPECSLTFRFIRDHKDELMKDGFRMTPIDYRTRDSLLEAVVIESRIREWFSKSGDIVFPCSETSPLDSHQFVECIRRPDRKSVISDLRWYLDVQPQCICGQNHLPAVQRYYRMLCQEETRMGKECNDSWNWEISGGLPVFNEDSDKQSDDFSANVRR